MIMPSNPMFGGYIRTVCQPKTKHQSQYILQIPDSCVLSLKYSSALMWFLFHITRFTCECNRVSKYNQFDLPQLV